MSRRTTFRFNRRINKTPSKMEQFISNVTKEEVYFRKEILHLKSGKIKTASKKNAEIDVQEYLQGLAFSVAKYVHFLFIKNLYFSIFRCELFPSIF